MKQENSIKYYKKAIQIIPGGTQTLSKYYPRNIPEIYPAYINYGEGCEVVDIDGNRYIDYTASLGPIILGYDFFDINLNDDDINSPLLPLPNIDEIELAELLCEIIPCAEMVRFFKTGSDATSAAVRLTRAITGRGNIICCGYHGWHDWYAETLPYPKSGGVTISGMYGKTTKIEYGDLKKLEEYFSEYSPACFILEPMNRLCPEKASYDYLSKVKKLCENYRVILIFDEIIMGFRYALAGGQEYYGVTPDLATYSKAMANGYPIAALVGKREYMQQIKDLQISGTYFTESHSIDMAIRTIETIRSRKVIKDIQKKGEILQIDIDGLIERWELGEYIKIIGFGPWFKLIFNDELMKKEFLKFVVQRGILTFDAEHFIMYCHEEQHIQKTLSIYNDAFHYIFEGL